MSQLSLFSSPLVPSVNDPLALHLLRVIREQYRYSRQGIMAGMARDLCGLPPDRLGRTAFYQRFVMLREAGLIELDGKRWRPVYYRTEFKERNKVA